VVEQRMGVMICGGKIGLGFVRCGDAATLGFL